MNADQIAKFKDATDASPESCPLTEIQKHVLNKDALTTLFLASEKFMKELAPMSTEKALLFWAYKERLSSDDVKVLLAFGIVAQEGTPGAVPVLPSFAEVAKGKLLGIEKADEAVVKWALICHALVFAAVKYGNLCSATLREKDTVATVTALASDSIEEMKHYRSTVIVRTVLALLRHRVKKETDVPVKRFAALLIANVFGLASILLGSTDPKDRNTWYEKADAQFSSFLAKFLPRGGSELADRLAPFSTNVDLQPLLKCSTTTFDELYDAKYGSPDIPSSPVGRVPNIAEYYTNIWKAASQFRVYQASPQVLQSRNLVAFQTIKAAIAASQSSSSIIPF